MPTKTRISIYVWFTGSENALELVGIDEGCNLETGLKNVVNGPCTVLQTKIKKQNVNNSRNM
jgi:hypothetical protein